MITRITPHFVDLVYGATIKSFWRKEALKRFLRNSAAPQEMISAWGEQTKRSFLDGFFAQLEDSAIRDQVLLRMAKGLAEQTSFPDLTGWEDSKEKIAEAGKSVDALKSYLEEQEREISAERQKVEAREKFHDLQKKTMASQRNLENLSMSLNSLVSELGTQQGGYKFQDWFYDLMEHFDIVSRRPYNVAGRQIDGSITLKDTTFLVELKFTADQAGAPEIDTFLRKVTTKADNTMGIFLSMSGFSSVAVSEASRDKSPILLMDHAHLYHVLGATSSFHDVLDRVKRHAHQTGSCYLSPSDF